MSEYRRNYVAGGTYFFTLVAHERRQILTTDLGHGDTQASAATLEQPRTGYTLRDYTFSIAASGSTTRISGRGCGG